MPRRDTANTRPIAEEQNQALLRFSQTDGWAPVDSFDFTGLKLKAHAPTDPSADLTAWHYARANDKANHPWCFVYPGRYDGSPRGSSRPNPTRHQQGTQEEAWSVPLPAHQETDPWGGSAAGPAIQLGDEDTRATYPARQVRPIQLANTDQPSPRNPNGFPFGGFARDADILHVPFIGATRLYAVEDDGFGDLQPITLMEMNAISMDAAFAEDTDLDDDQDGSGLPIEQIGRFCPVWPSTASNSDSQTNDGPNDINHLDKPNDWDTVTADCRTRWRYRWAMRLFDYLGTEIPYRDRFPNRPVAADEPVTGSPVRNADPGHANDELEKTVGIQGLVNINTAPWKVLASLPLAYSNGRVDPEKTVELAKAIARYRDGNGTSAMPAHGAFRNVYDLYRVPEVWRYIKEISHSGEPDDADGDLSPFNPTLEPGWRRTDGVRGDYKERLLFLTHVSNLITTRSDTFTAYITVQGWRDAGTPSAALVAQRRLGVIVDRNNLTVRNHKPRLIPFSPE